MKLIPSFLAALAFPLLTSAIIVHPKKQVNATSDLVQITDKLLFQESLSNFVITRQVGLANLTNPSATPPPYNQLDWMSDGCTHAPEAPFGYDFEPACWRHDFGYRNYKKQGRFSEATRKQIDDEMLDDMLDVCDREDDTEDELLCQGTAVAYYEAVRAFGDDDKKMADEFGKQMDGLLAKNLPRLRKGSGNSTVVWGKVEPRWRY
jgi:hypothetical protein